MIEVDLKALFKTLNEHCLSCLEGAAGICVARGHYEVTIEHALLKLYEEPAYDVQKILSHYGVDNARFQRGLHRVLEKAKTGNAGKPVFSQLLIDWIKDAWLLASVEMGMNKTRSGMLLLTLILNPYRYGQDEYLDQLKAVPSDDLKRQFLNITGGSSENQSAAVADKASTPGGLGVAGSDSGLAKFTVDFTGKARQGLIDPVFCRDREIRQMIDILGRRRKNNPILVGEAGVGKTAVVEGLALAIVNGEVPDILKDVELYGLDLGLLQAGASVKGEFEKRLKSVIEEVKASPKPIILFIDEAHTLIGAGGQAGGSDAANLLKPALARGELRTVAATTWSEYKKYFEKDPALARRFQLIKVEEPSVNDAVVIMRGLCETYEQSHQVYIRDDAIEASASLAARYISGRQLPDKSVDLLDTACARVKISISAKPEIIEQCERQVKTLNRELEAVRRDIHTGVCEDDGRLKQLNKEIEANEIQKKELLSRWQQEKSAVEKILDLRRQMTQAAATPAELLQLKKDIAAIEQELKKIQKEEALIQYEVSPETISRVISDWTGIPVGSMVKDEAQVILQFKDNLSQRIKGQDQAMTALDRGIKAAKAGLGNPRTPIGVFLFVGPSGVGKTESALGLADLLFGGERFLITINMSEFQEKHTVSRLIGSPPGYVGYGEGGVLTEGVRQRPYAVVLLDEVEKADMEVMNLFYQVFDKGSLSDGEGREIDFKNTILILTSNLASDIITQMCSSDQRPDAELLASAIRPVLSQHFKPALLARMEIVPFYPISSDAMKEIVTLKLNQLGKRVATNQRMQFEYSPAVVEQISQRCKEVETGARNIDHIINRTLLPQMAAEILQMLSSDKKPHTLKLGINGDGSFSCQFVS